MYTQMCDICNRLLDEGEPVTHLRIEWEHENSGRFLGQVMCQKCYNELSGKIDAAIHDAKFKMRKESNG